MPEMTAGLRERLERVLRTTPTKLLDDPAMRPEGWPTHGDGHSYDMTCALCRGEADTLAAALLPVVGAVLQEQGAGLVEAEAELGTTSRARDKWYRKAQELRQRAERAEAAIARALDLLGREHHYESSYTAQGIGILREAHDGSHEPCRSTRFCVDNGYCHRCDPERSARAAEQRAALDGTGEAS